MEIDKIGKKKKKKKKKKKIQHYTLNTNYSKGTWQTIQHYTLKLVACIGIVSLFSTIVIQLR
jgi:hypothetical protein